MEAVKRRVVTPLRVLAVGAFVLLTGCGTSSAQSGATIVNLGTTNWATIPTTPPTVATIPGTTLPPVPGSKTTEVTTYKIKANDNPTMVANFYGITLQELNEINATTSGYAQFLVGLNIKIPIGATIPADNTAPGETVPTLVPVMCGTYTLASGDFPGSVAKKFKVTVKALDAANEDTNGYGGFIVGTKINIPCEAGSENNG